MMKTILITGATGFIGSHIAKGLVSNKTKVVAIKRDSSDLWRVNEIKDQIIWINIESKDLDKEIERHKPDTLIHTAWEGVSADKRNDWELQKKNFELSQKFFHLAINAGVKKIITLGSQAELGNFNKRINENYNPEPVDAYGAYKLHTLNYLKINALKYDYQWFWIRVFSVFGPMENPDWLMPQVIKKLLKNEKIELTAGEQKYDYMFIDDFVYNLMQVINYQKSASGVFNLSSGNSISIRTLLTNLCHILSKDEQLLRFGVIPYRKHQTMLMEGDNSKFNDTFCQIKTRSLQEALKVTVKTYS